MSDTFALRAFIVALDVLAIAVVGALTGIASLAGQIITRRRGAHMRLKVSSAHLADGDWGVSDWRVCFSPANVGAAPVQVTGWGLEMPNKRGTLIQTRPIAASVTLPQFLEPGTSISLFWLQEDVR